MAIHYMTQEGLDKLKKTVDLKKATAFFSKGGPTLPPLLVKARLDGELRRFILSGGFDVNNKC